MTNFERENEHENNVQDKESNTQDQEPDTWVVFSGQTDLPWLRLFKPGFRHCYVLMNDGDRWVTLDPLSSHTELRVHHMPGDFDLPLWLKSRGLRVVKTKLFRVQKQAPWMVFTCVEAVKRVLGLHKRLIFTPWQLYCHLTKDQSYNRQGDFVWEV